MKKLSTFIIAAALIFGMAQCKKQEAPVKPATPEADGKWVHISISVDDGAKHDVFPSTGAVVYGENDVIYVGNNGHYVGMLTYNSGTFSGNIYNPSSSDFLHFYFVGGLNPSVDLNNGDDGGTPTTSFTVNISNQSAKLPVLSYGQSDKKYTEDTTTYSCTLQNKCALVEFSLVEGTNGAVTVSGMHTQATVSFANTDNAIVPTNATGTITLKSETANSMWAILLPQGEVTNATVTVKGKPYENVTVPAVAANDYVHGTITINNSNDYVFSVSASSTVHFAPGNLQATYDGTSWSWAFAAHQWDYIGNGGGNKKVTNTDPWIIGTGTVDLFGWSEFSHNHFGINSSTDNGQYMGGNFMDWGVKANAMNLLGHSSGWKTLTQAEWDYVLNTRSTFSGKRYAKATVNGVSGVILLPDNWSTTTYSLNNTNTSTANYNSNTIDATHWTTLENAGAVFLPAAGYRSGTTVSDFGSVGRYWSATSNTSNVQQAKCLWFNAKYVVPNPDNTDNSNNNQNQNRSFGHSVRLVRPAQ